MASKARQYKPSDVKKLFALSGNQCAEPSCQRKLISDDGNNVLAEIAHICAASEEGPRFDASMTDDQRRSFGNLILLCDEHHKMIDNPETVDNYPASMIEKWKTKHEEGNKDIPINEELSKTFIQNAEKIYNIDHIDTANFS